MKKFLLSFLCMLTIFSLSNAGEYVDGYTTPAGYVYRGGLWWLNGQAYTRTLFSTPACYNGCNYTPASSYYNYYSVNLPNSTPTAPALPSYKDPGWRGKLLDIAAARDKREGEIRSGAFEQAYFLDAVSALGLQGNFRWNGYGGVPPYFQQGGAAVGGQGAYGYQMTGQLYNFGANANTQYGASFNSIASVYGDNNTAQLFQQAAQLAQQAQKLGGDATGSFHSLVGQEGGNRAKVAEILAKGQQAQQILDALRAAPSTETKGFNFKISPVGIQAVDAGVDPTVKQKLSTDFTALINNKCAKCHSGDNVKANFDITKWSSFSPDDRNKIMDRLTTDDPKKLMPRGDDGVGHRLLGDELKLFLLN